METWWFAAFKNHIEFYPTSSAMDAFNNELPGYEVSKGTTKLPLGNPFP